MFVTGKLTLDPLAIGNPKMKVHKACLGKLFESNELVLDAEGGIRGGERDRVVRSAIPVLTHRNQRVILGGKDSV